MNLEKPSIQAESENGLNNRQEFMLNYLNSQTGSAFPLNEEGYNEAGRSEGIIEKLGSNEEDKEKLRIYFLSISRTKS